MKLLKVFGWVFVPYVMIFAQWKKIKLAPRVIGTIWSVIAVMFIVASLSNSNEDKATTAAGLAVKQGGDVVSSASVTGASKPSDAPTSKPTEQPKNKPTITKEEFEQVQNGMTYDEVTKIIGGPGEIMSEVGTKGDQFYTVIYMYKGESLGANANLTFQGGKLNAKAQFGLK